MIAEFTFNVLQSWDVTKREDRTLKDVRKYTEVTRTYKVTFLIAYQDTEIVGWIGIILEHPSMATIDAWCPFVKSGKDEDDIADLLIESGMEFSLKTGRERIEIFLMGLTEKTMPRYDKYRKWYERREMVRDNEWAYMVCDLQSYSEEELALPDNYEFIPLSQRTNDEIYPSYYASFITGSDPRFLEQTDQQRRSFFDEMFDRS